MSAHDVGQLGDAVNAAAQPFTTLRLFYSDTQLTVQPKSAAGASEVDTLSVDLRSGSVQQLQGQPQRSTPVEILGILGLCKLYKGCSFAVITKAQKVATLAGADIFKVKETRLYTSRDANSVRENRGLLKLLHDALNPEGSGRSLYFSYNYDLTLTAQRIANIASDPALRSQAPAARAEPRFFWNRSLAKPLMDVNAHRFVVPVMLGFVRQLPGLQFRSNFDGSTVEGTVTLIARRSTLRAGTRHWRRGADTDGNVANFVETEQMLTLDGGDVLASYVQLRGSIPLLWTQLPNIRYKPTTLIAPEEASGAALTKHFNSLIELYKGVVAVNLVNQGKGSEGKLEAAFQREAEKFCASNSGLRYVAFDFHKECSKSRYDRLSRLWDRLSEDFNKQGFLLVTSRGVQRWQEGVVRTNCIDCLDRTNVVQGILARKSLEAMLRVLGLLNDNISLPEAYPHVEHKFKILWADHGDEVATQYAGTGAMKSGFTRTGKRTLGGAIDDGIKAVTRYYLNNFQDGKKQDALDLVTGAYVVDGVTKPPIKPQPSPLLPIIIALFALSTAAHQATQMLSGATAGIADSLTTDLHGSNRQLQDDDEVTHVRARLSPAGGLGGIMMDVVKHVVFPAAFGLGLLLMVVKNGKHLVNKPQLCPNMAATVAKPKRD